MTEPILQAKGICKSFPGVKALDHVDFELYPGEVHILVGENGAGKSTLVKVLLGAYQPDAGEIYIEGERCRLHSPKDAIEKGIVAVYQELTMVPYLNVAQNIYLNREPVTRFTHLIDGRTLHANARAILDKLNCQRIDTHKKVKDFGVADQQMIEIAKALSNDPKVIVFDEPTATLSEREIHTLFEQITYLKKLGLGIIYISHRMSEFEQIGDRITVLRDGHYIRSLHVGDLTKEELVNLMVGRDISQAYVRNINSFPETALSVENISDKNGRVRQCSLNVKRGEIVGLCGLVGSGRTELARMIFGIDKPQSGKVRISGEDVTGRSPGYIISKGLGMVTEDRKGLGLALKQPVSWNILAVSLKKYFPYGLLSEKKVRRVAKEFVDKLAIATPGVTKCVGELSGGNQQKVVIAKWLSENSDVLIFDEPTRGIDVGAKMEIYALMDRLVAEGKAILMISSEMEEIIGMSDRIYVMKNGSISGELQRHEFSAERLGTLMLGVE